MATSVGWGWSIFFMSACSGYSLRGTFWLTAIWMQQYHHQQWGFLTCLPLLYNRQRSDLPACTQIDQNTSSPGGEKQDLMRVSPAQSISFLHMQDQYSSWQSSNLIHTHMSYYLKPTLQFSHAKGKQKNCSYISHTVPACCYRSWSHPPVILFSQGSSVSHCILVSHNPLSTRQDSSMPPVSDRIWLPQLHS